MKVEQSERYVLLVRMLGRGGNKDRLDRDNPDRQTDDHTHNYNIYFFEERRTQRHSTIHFQLENNKGRPWIVLVLSDKYYFFLLLLLLQNTI